MRAFVTLLLVAACGSGPKTVKTAQPEPVAVEGPIVWSLEVVPPTFALAEQGRVSIWIQATNRGAETLDTERSDSFTLDGEDSMELNMAFGNGGREARWRALPTGDTIREQRIGLELFTSAGDHVIALVGPDGRERARVTVTVTP
jgi:hypothetical protein